jgi:Protein of unknown function (DUF3604)
VWQGRGVLFLSLKMSQNSIDDVLVFDARDNSDRSTAATTNCETSPEGLWGRLKELCLDTEGDCDVLTIPHNPNHSSGRMFPLSDPSDPIEERRARARLAAEMEPLVEMMQIKGESECRNGLWGVTGAPDEFCDLEKWVPLENQKDCEGDTGIGKSMGLGCVSRTDYARYTIAAGMAEERELGVNPIAWVLSAALIRTTARPVMWRNGTGRGVPASQTPGWRSD